MQLQRLRVHWMMRGVTMTDPASVFVDFDATIGMDTVIRPNTMVLGRSNIGEGCEVGPGSVVRDSSIGDGCRVTSSVVEESVMEAGSDIGPYSHLRPGAYLESGVHIGNFVEIKESRLSAGTLMGHFGYVGDATIGAKVNVGQVRSPVTSTDGTNTVRLSKTARSSAATPCSSPRLPWAPRL